MNRTVVSLDLYFLPLVQKLFAIEMAEFKVQIKCMWNSETNEFEKITEEEPPAQGEDDEEEENDAE